MSGTLCPTSKRQTCWQRIAAACLAAIVFALGGVRDAAAQAQPIEIVELARALKYDPDLIYEYVYNNIETLPQYGSLKGAYGALLDGKGTAFDQVELMAALLRESGHSFLTAFGQIELSAAQLTNWLGTDTSLGGAYFTLGSGGFAATMLLNPGGTEIVGAYVPWAWIAVSIGGSTYYFDPSTKVYNRSGGLPSATIETALGYDRSTFVTRALSGSSTTLASITGINRPNIRGDLNAYASNLARYIRTNNFAASTADIIGGKSIIPLAVGTQLRQTFGLPYQHGSPSYALGIPSQYRTTLKLELGSVDAGNTFTALSCTIVPTCAVTFNSSDIYGRRIVVAFDGSLAPTLLLDGVEQFTATSAVPSGRQLTIRTSINHPYPGSPPPDNVTNSLQIRMTPDSTKKYLIATGWGQSGRGMIEKHRRLLQENIAQFPGDPTAEPVLGENLAVIGYTWLAELSRNQVLIDQLAGTSTAYHHAVGVVGVRDLGGSIGPFVDLPLNRFSIIQRSQPNSGALNPVEAAAFFAQMMFFSIAESGVLEQTQPGAVAVSTVKLIDSAVQAGGQIFDINNSSITSDNYAYYLSTIRPVLQSTYGGGDLARIDSLANTPSNRRIIAPANGAITIDQFTGAGYFSIDQAGAEIAALITGGLNGGYAASPVTFEELAFNTPISVMPSWIQTSEISNPSLSSFGNAGGLLDITPISWEPINLVTGDYLLNTTDLAIGSMDIPYGLSFQRYYDSGTRLQGGPLGFGWTHNFAITASASSDAFEGLAINSPVNGAAGIAAVFVAFSILSDTAAPNMPLDRVVVASIVQRWLMDQLKDNIVAVSQAGAVQHFSKLSDGSYNSPLGVGAILELQNGAYTYMAKDRTTLSFDAMGNLVKWKVPAGPAISFAYSGSPARLTSISNNLGRSLSLSYSGDSLTQVADETGRFVSYSYDSTGNLVGFTDPLGNLTRYVYDLRGQLSQYFYPDTIIPFVSNFYDPLGRVRTQTNANGDTWQYFFGGSRTEEVDPFGTQHVLYMTPRGRTRVEIQDYAGQRLQTFSTYDGLDRLISIAAPEGDSTVTAYEVTVNAWANNVASITRNPKPGPSPPPPSLATSFTYEANFNKPLTVTDPLGTVTSMSYDHYTGNLHSTVADAMGLRATTRYTYDTVGLMRSASDPEGIVTRFDYDSVGNRIRTTADAGVGRINRISSYSYDALGNVITVTDPRGAVTVNKYDAARRLTATVSPSPIAGAPNLVTTNSFDSQGRLLQVQQSVGDSVLRTTSTTWTPTGKPATTTDPKGSTTRFTYDALDRRISIRDPMDRVTQFSWTVLSQPFQTHNLAISASPLLEQAYTQNGQLWKQKDSNGNTTEFAYDRFDRLSTTTYPLSSTEAMSYDANGNMLSLKTRANDTITFTYDALNRLSAKAIPSNPVVTYRYDLANRLISVSDTSATIPSVAAPVNTTAYATAYFYDALNRLTDVTWDPAPIATTPTAGPLVTFTHSYNKANQRVQQEVTDDAWFNRPATSPEVTYQANQLNQYTQITKSGGPTVTPTYDANGNLISDGTYSFTYDVDKRLVDAVGGGNSASYSYDAQGRRKSRTVNGTTTISVTDADNREVLEYDASSGAILSWFAYGLSVNSALNRMDVPTSGRTIFLPDLLGSVVGSFASGTGALSTFRYQPFGLTSAAATPFGYTGQRFDPETSLYYFRARHYSPLLGRFMQADPSGYSAGTNLYAYVANDPLNAVDPLGLYKEGSQASFQPLSLPAFESAAQSLPALSPSSSPANVWQVADKTDSPSDEIRKRYRLPTRPKVDLDSGPPAPRQIMPPVPMGLPGMRPPSLSPEGAGRDGAFNEAKRLNGIPTSQQPAYVGPNIDERGKVQPGRVYYFDLPAPGGGTRRTYIRDDASGHYYGPHDPQNRGPHFNDPRKNHYDY